MHYYLAWRRCVYILTMLPPPSKFEFPWGGMGHLSYYIHDYFEVSEHWQLPSKATPICPFHVSIYCPLMSYSWLFSFHLNTFPSDAFFFTLIHLFSLGGWRPGLLELHILIVVEYLMLLFSPLHPGGVLNGNTLLWITQQGAPWLIELLTIY